MNNPTGISDHRLTSKLGQPTEPKYNTVAAASKNTIPNNFFICLSPSSFFLDLVNYFKIQIPLTLTIIARHFFKTSPFAYLVTILVYVVVVTDKKEVQRTSRFYRLKTIFD